MAGRLRYTMGEPCWVEVGAPDLAAAEDFYRGLFGWDFEPRGRSASTALLRDQPVAALEPGSPAWTAYISVGDLQESARRAESLGGVLLSEIDRVYDEGREQGWAVRIADPERAELALWEASTFEGAAVRGVPGTFCWTELAVRDTAAAARFYERMFGWRGRVMPFLDGPGGYTEFDLKGARATVAGMVQMTPAWPEEIPPHWMVYFAVDDCEAAADRVDALGGSVQIEPFELPSGLATVVEDVHGAVLSLIELFR